MQFVGASAWSAAAAVAQGRDEVEGGCHLRAIVPVGAPQPQAERRAAGIGDEVALGTRLA